TPPLGAGKVDRPPAGVASQVAPRMTNVAAWGLDGCPAACLQDGRAHGTEGRSGLGGSESFREDRLALGKPGEERVADPHRSSRLGSSRSVSPAGGGGQRLARSRRLFCAAVPR